MKVSSISFKSQFITDVFEHKWKHTQMMFKEDKKKIKFGKMEEIRRHFVERYFEVCEEFLKRK